MKTKGWSSSIKKAAGAYLAIKAAKKFRPKLWVGQKLILASTKLTNFKTGYGYEGDDFYRSYSEIERCFRFFVVLRTLLIYFKLPISRRR